MRYTSDEALAEIMRRREKIVLRRDRRTLRVLSGLSGTLAAALLLVIGMIPGRSGQASVGTVYGSFLLSAEHGGYVLAAVIAFALGVLVTLLLLRYKAGRTPDPKPGAEETTAMSEEQTVKHTND